MIIKNKTAKELKSHALRLIAKRAHSSFELAKKLENKNYQKKQIDELIAFFLESKYLDDELFLKNYIEEMIFKNKSKNFILQKLYQKGFNKNQAQKYFLNINWSEKALLVLQKKYISNSIKNINLKQKAHNFLKNKGFSYEEILLALDKFF